MAHQNRARYAARLCWLLAAVTLLAACASRNETPDDTGDGQSETVPAPQGLSIRNARNFDIQYLDGGVKLLVDAAGRELLLVPRGSAAPSGHESAVQVSTPVTRTMFASASHVSFLEALEDGSLYASIAVLTADAPEWTNQAVLDAFASGQITCLTPDVWTSGDLEAVAAVEPGLVFLDPTSEEGAVLAGMLDQAGIPYAAAAEWSESSGEARLEWLRFFAAFYNLDQEAADLYDAKLERLEELYAQGGAAAEGERPAAAFCSVSGGTVYTQAGGSGIARLLERAGAVYALADLEGQGETQMTMEDFSQRCRDADVLIYAALPEDMAGTLLDEDILFADFKAYQEGRVFTLDSACAMKSAQVVEQFQDLLAICHPEQAADHVFTVYRPLAG